MNEPSPERPALNQSAIESSPDRPALDEAATGQPAARGRDPGRADPGQPGSRRPGSRQPAAEGRPGSRQPAAEGRTVLIGSFAALGDSFTEGLNDLDTAGRYRGWADRFAQLLSEHNPDLRYANLAIRGKRLGQVAAEQVPAAIGMSPDLVSIAAGGNDLLRPRADPDVLASAFDGAVAALRAAGSEVVIFTGFDTRQFPVLRMLRGKVATYNMHLRAIADRRGCHLADLWSMSPLSDARAWSADRLHLSAEGHRRVALRVSEVLGVPVTADWRERWPPAPPVSWLPKRSQDLRWARHHALPWVSRRVRRVSSGDGLPPKRPELLPFQP
jgi:lysophospholipase L1-like esterase